MMTNLALPTYPVKREEGKPVVVIERLALGFDRKPLEWRRSHGAADTFRYQIDIC